jgi:hypothetical protein
MLQWKSIRPHPFLPGKNTGHVLSDFYREIVTLLSFDVKEIPARKKW